ncbi:hypothetical protein D9757_002768 [Collybiopsis confluens]|uniref:WD40 repeat-like protein n=1 Tax=Collybiopsis confluens TaxID=2823264 RepID=A0A8H5ME81_9AGAR|nr:hypothetical protein D9757_002768 [Collybiopsis confluens]
MLLGLLLPSDLSMHPDSVSIHSYLNKQSLPSFVQLSAFQKQIHAKSLEKTWDRVAVLGDNRVGHAGCVNALHWAQGGELLLSAGDDTTVQVWRTDPTDLSQNYPFVSRTVIHTGHKANIFNCNMLPYSSSRVVTVAGDKQVRVFDVGRDQGISPARQEYHASRAMTHVFKCHEDRVKRIASEESPDKFLTVSEVGVLHAFISETIFIVFKDGTVRQHDLRTSHSCRSNCPAPLIRVRHELSTIATASYNCVVAGDSPYVGNPGSKWISKMYSYFGRQAYLFDRRFTGRDLRDEWGSKGEGLTACVRRFGRPNQRASRKGHLFPGEHITGARMSSDNGHEVLLSYSADGVYLFSTLDDPDSNNSFSSSIDRSLIPKRRKVTEPGPTSSASPSSSADSNDVETDDEERETDDCSDDADDEDNIPSAESINYHPWVPTVYPRRRYAGARNVDTVKDVNFLGPRDEYVASGSDDGMFFVWHKSTGKLRGVYEGDGTVVNVIEGHPHLPLVALFAPIDHESTFSRLNDADPIMRRNLHRSNIRTIRTIRRLDFVNLLAAVQGSSLGAEGDNDQFDAASDCVNQ